MPKSWTAVIVCPARVIPVSESILLLPAGHIMCWMGCIYYALCPANKCKYQSRSLGLLCWLRVLGFSLAVFLNSLYSVLATYLCFRVRRSSRQGREHVRPANHLGLVNCA